MQGVKMRKATRIIIEVTHESDGKEIAEKIIQNGVSSIENELIRVISVDIEYTKKEKLI